MNILQHASWNNYETEDVLIGVLLYHLFVSDPRIDCITNHAYATFHSYGGHFLKAACFTAWLLSTPTCVNEPWSTSTITYKNIKKYNSAKDHLEIQLEPVCAGRYVVKDNSALIWDALLIQSCSMCAAMWQNKYVLSHNLSRQRQAGRAVSIQTNFTHVIKAKSVSLVIMLSRSE